MTMIGGLQHHDIGSGDEWGRYDKNGVGGQYIRYLLSVPKPLVHGTSSSSQALPSPT